MFDNLGTALVQALGFFAIFGFFVYQTLFADEKNKISNEIIDTLALAREKFPGSQISLDALCKRYKIDNSKRVNHTALIDCDLLSKDYINLIDQKEPTLDFTNQDYEKKDYSKANLSYYKKVIKPSENELKNHREYLKNSLKKNYF